MSLINRLLKSLINFLVHTPFYPHWLWNKKMIEGNAYVLNGIHGNVLEVGAGDGSRKDILLKEYPRITNYIATDYSDWDSEFEKIDTNIKKFSKLWSGVFGYSTRANLDKVCSATDLPFKNDTFNYHLSFEVLEHIGEPVKYFSEASRVLKNGGEVILSVPFLFRMHGGGEDHKMDFYRYAYGSIHDMATKSGFKVILIHSNTGVGTTVATLVNQWVIRLLFESNYFLRFTLLLFGPFIFVFTNIFGLFLDTKPDKRFATRFHLKLKKI